MAQAFEPAGGLLERGAGFSLETPGRAGLLQERHRLAPKLQELRLRRAVRAWEGASALRRPRPQAQTNSTSTTTASRRSRERGGRELKFL